MSEECGGCGQDHEDYDPTSDPLVMSFAMGTPKMSSGQLMGIFQAITTEIYVRSAGQDFQEIWQSMHSQVTEMFDVATSPDLESLQELTRIRDELGEERDIRDADKANGEAGDELEAMLDEHGVLGEDEAYGNYL